MVVLFAFFSNQDAFLALLKKQRKQHSLTQLQFAVQVLKSASTEYCRDHDRLLGLLDLGNFNLEVAGNRKMLRDLFRCMSFAGGYEDRTLAPQLPDAHGMADWHNTHQEWLNLQELRAARNEEAAR